MRSMVSLIDTNVIINFITDREDPYLKECNELMELCTERKFDGYIAFHSLSTIWYVIKRQKSEDEARFWLKRICDIMIIAGATQEQVADAIENTDFRDFEDCLQDECAVNVSADYIVTCNAKDYKQAKTVVVTPDEFVRIVKENQSIIE